MKEALHARPSILSRLREAQGNGLSPSHRRVASYLLENHKAVAFDTAAQIGRRVGISEATVVRFARALGYAGFPALQRDLKASVLQALTTLERLRQPPGIGRRRAAAAVLERVARQETENMERLAGLNDPDHVRAWVRALDGAGSVAVTGMQASAALAAFFGFQLGKVRRGVSWFGSADIVAFHYVARMSRRDLLCVLAFPRYPRLLVELGRFAHERGMRVLVMTDSELSPVAGTGAPALYAPTTSTSFVDGYAAPVCLINAVISNLSRAALRSARGSLAAYERAAERVGAFERL